MSVAKDPKRLPADNEDTGCTRSLVRFFFCCARSDVKPYQVADVCSLAAVDLLPARRKNKAN